MSSTTTPKRAGLDAFYTPDDVARACIGTLGNLRGLACWEPHAGGGAFVRALMDAGGVTYWSDIDANAAVYKGDLLTVGPGSVGYAAHDALAGWPWTMRAPPAWIVGNPPFNEAEAHVRRAIETASIGVGFLLRLAFLEGAKRRAFWREHPPAEVHVLVSRPSFTGGGTDSAAYGWFVWRRGHVGPAHLRFLDWRSA